MSKAIIKKIIQHHIDHDNATLHQCVVNAAIEFPTLFSSFKVLNHEIRITHESKTYKFKTSAFNYDPLFV